jgi:hypothetical protein
MVSERNNFILEEQDIGQKKKLPLETVLFFTELRALLFIA